MSEAAIPGATPTPTAPQPSQSPITLSGAETLTSFDDISAIDPTVKTAKTPKEPKATKAPKEESGEKQAKAPEVPKEGEPTEAEAKKIRKILAKMGEEQLELTPDTVFRHKVSGEEVDVPLQDLLNEYAGKTDWSRKYTELDKTKKTLAEKERFVQRVHGTMKQFKDLAENDPSNALEFLLDSYGVNGRETIKGIHQQWSEKYQEMANLDEPERKAREFEEEATYYKRKIEQQQEAQRKQQENAALTQKVEALKQQHGIKHEEFVSAYQELASSPEYQQMRKENPDFQLQPEMVANFVSIKNFKNQIHQHLVDIGHDAASDINSVYEQINFVAQRFPHLSNKELIKVVKESFGGKSQKKENPLKEKITTAKTGFVNKEIKPYEAFSFDDI
jgi:hypothetical protein